jgi:hypothetical protein
LAVGIGCAREKTAGTLSGTQGKTPQPSETLSGNVYVTQFPKAGLSASLTFSTPPKMGMNAPFTLKFWVTGKGSPEQGPFIDPPFRIADADLFKAEPLACRLWMPDHGHGSDDLRVQKRITKPGTSQQSVVFLVDNVFFSMIGNWHIEVNFHSTHLDGAGRKHFVMRRNPETNEEEPVNDDSGLFKHLQK